MELNKIHFKVDALIIGVFYNVMTIYHEPSTSLHSEQCHECGVRQLATESREEECPVGAGLVLGGAGGGTLDKPRINVNQD